MTGTGIAVEIMRETLGDIRLVKGRGILALMGVAIGTAAVIAMLHVGHNARKAALSQFETLGTDLVMIQPQATGTEAVPQVPIGMVLDLPKQGLGVSEVSAIVQTGGKVRSGRIDIQATIIAATDGLYTLGKARIDQGRATSDLDRFSPFAVIGSEIAARIDRASGRPVAAGDQISFGGQVLTVIGTLKDTPSNFILNIEFNRSIVVPFAAARRLISNPVIGNIAARLAPGASDQATAEALRNYFTKRMPNGFMQVTTAREMIASIEEQMRIYATLILGIGAVSLVVGGVGIMNVMLMSVMERRQEIGLRLAVGARRKDIRLMFLCETLILSLIGSGVGTCLGYVAGWIFTDSSGWQFEAAPLALPLGAGMALVVGLFFGIYPAARAARLDPVTALRSE
ncbi:putative ABC transport system permease protein [Neorhizobium sp. 2083]|uniref:ABC transporter permease n=1 Tax=Neorhizobium sp. 2083 TaxID=2817762 RepID=UPI0028577FC4|nr:ABC transporter permease [Neorhizobium sp. 2083]MDR6818773.1 putative ABC transport system permease protein [Neorhizobium sp. 2083]